MADRDIERTVDSGTDPILSEQVRLRSQNHALHMRVAELEVELANCKAGRYTHSVSPPSEVNE